MVKKEQISLGRDKGEKYMSKKSRKGLCGGQGQLERRGRKEEKREIEEGRKRREGNRGVGEDKKQHSSFLLGCPDGKNCDQNVSYFWRNEEKNPHQ